ncbi:MAG: hypothetical protein ACE5ID_07400 [Acidobacteriota bacterium]
MKWTTRALCDTLRTAAMGAFVVLACGSLLVTAAHAGHRDHGRRAQVFIASACGGEGGTADGIDISDLDVGETRVLATASGKDVEITRQEHGYLLNVDGKKIHLDIPGAGEARNIWVEKLDDGHGVHTMVIAGGADDNGDADSGTGASLEARSMVFLGGAQGGADSVLISGLDDLNEDQRQEIIDALRGAGIDKEIRFGPAMGHGFNFVTTCDDHENGSGDCVRILKKRIYTRLIDSDDDDQDNEEVVVISLDHGKKAIVKIRSADDDSSHSDDNRDDDSSDSPFHNP